MNPPPAPHGAGTMRMTRKQMDWWADVRLHGRTWYVWRYGGLAFGVPMGTVWPVTMAAFFGWDSLPRLAAIAAPLFLAGGVAFGHYLWRATESRYAAALREYDGEPGPPRRHYDEYE